MSIAKLAVSFIAVTGSIFAYGPELTKDFQEPLVVERHIPVPKKSLETIIFEASQAHKVPAMLIRAVIEVESAGDASAIRFEERHLSRITWERNPDKRRQWASSIGLMQVMAWHLQKLKPGASYSLLYDPEVNVHVGAKILSDCMARHEGAPKKVQVTRALVCYNGSETYPPKVLGALAAEVIEREL